MPDALVFICYLVAFVCWVVCALSIPVPRLNLVCVGLSFAILPTLWAAAESV